jgi:hypothetical protein
MAREHMDFIQGQPYAPPAERLAPDPNVPEPATYDGDTLTGEQRADGRGISRYVS